MSQSNDSVIVIPPQYFKAKNYASIPGPKSQKVSIDRVLKYRLYKSNKQKSLDACSQSMYTHKNFDTDDKDFERHQRAIYILRKQVNKENMRCKDTVKLYSDKLQMCFRRHKLKKDKQDAIISKNKIRNDRRIEKEDYCE